MLKLRTLRIYSGKRAAESTRRDLGAMAIAVVVAGLLLLGATELPAQDTASLTGSWLLDEERSDDPGEIVEKADHGGTVGRILRSTSGSVVILGIPVPELPRDTERSKPRSHDSASLVKSGHVLSAIDRLTITQDREATELLYDTLKAATYEHGVPLNTGYSTVVASWNGDKLVVEHSLIGGAEITETYELDSRADELHWNVRVKNKDIRTIRVSRVYRRAEAPASSLNFSASTRESR